MQAQVFSNAPSPDDVSMPEWLSFRLMLRCVLFIKNDDSIGWCCRFCVRIFLFSIWVDLDRVL
jgi:hypothetical protein